ncbi:DedA family protein [Paenibacillus sp. MBLB4367]|uniref:DedA family protein n=1 Tax=Paenibacillus sp. MBLB4367 TaxID=3384767 RepID=UPI003907FAFE
MHIHVHELLAHYGYWGVFFLLMAEMIGIPFPAETALAIAGIGLSDGTFSFFPLFAAALLGNIAGSTIAYWLGRRFGHAALLKYGKAFGITEQRLDKAERKLLKYRLPVIFLSRFIAGLRVFVPYLAGINRLPFNMFAFHNTCAAAIWVTAFLFLGRYMHAAWSRIHMHMHGGMLLLLGGVLVIAVAFKLIWQTKRA